jgi:outer membrane protein insertion porin family
VNRQRTVGFGPVRLVGSAIALLLLIASTLHAQSGLTGVRGGGHFGNETLQSLVRNVPRDSAEEFITRLYFDNGFFDAIVSVDPTGLAEITEGARYRIGTVRRDDSAAVARMPGASITGEYYSSAAVGALIESIVIDFNSRGYPLASARLVGLDPVAEDHRVDLTIAVDSGDRVVIEEIDVRGNNETTGGLVVNPAAVPPGTLFTDDLAASVRARLVRLNIFSDVSEPQLYRSDSGRYGLLLVVQEGNANTFDGLVGYQPPTVEGESGSITGLVNITFRNLFGSGRRFALRWQPSRDRTDLEVRYAEPFILGIPLDAEISYRLHQESPAQFLPSYVQRALGADFYYTFADLLRVRGGAALEETIPELDTLQPCDRQLLNSRTLQTTIGVAYDSRNSQINPTGGARYSTTFTLGDKLVRNAGNCSDTLVDRSESQRRIEADLEAYMKLFPTIVLAGGVHGGELRGLLLEESDLFQFGGQSSVRGYREGEFRASRRLWGSLELRAILASTTYVGLFVDGGYYYRPPSTIRGIEPSEEWIAGYGVAGQFESPLGLIRLSFSLGRDDTFETGKVFVGLANQF